MAICDLSSFDGKIIAQQVHMKTSPWELCSVFESYTPTHSTHPSQPPIPATHPSHPSHPPIPPTHPTHPSHLPILAILPLVLQLLSWLPTLPLYFVFSIFIVKVSSRNALPTSCQTGTRRKKTEISGNKTLKPPAS